MDYYVVSQGKTTIPGVDDAEECTLTDVRWLIEISMKFYSCCTITNFKKRETQTQTPWFEIFLSKVSIILAILTPKSQPLSSKPLCWP